MSTPYETVNTMARYGGSFAQALAGAFERADQTNFNKLRAAFPELWQEYSEMADMVAERRRAQEAVR